MPAVESPAVAVPPSDTLAGFLRSLWPGHPPYAADLPVRHGGGRVSILVERSTVLEVECGAGCARGVAHDVQALLVLSRLAEAPQPRPLPTVRWPEGSSRPPGTAVRNAITLLEAQGPRRTATLPMGWLGPDSDVALGPGPPPGGEVRLGPIEWDAMHRLLVGGFPAMSATGEWDVAARLLAAGAVRLRGTGSCGVFRLLELTPTTVATSMFERAPSAGVPGGLPPVDSDAAARPGAVAPLDAAVGAGPPVPAPTDGHQPHPSPAGAQASGSVASGSVPSGLAGSAPAGPATAGPATTTPAPEGSLSSGVPVPPGSAPAQVDGGGVAATAARSPASGPLDESRPSHAVDGRRRALLQARRRAEETARGIVPAASGDAGADDPLAAVRQVSALVAVTPVSPVSTTTLQRLIEALRAL